MTPTAEAIALVNLDESDIVRHSLVQLIVEAYESAETRVKKSREKKNKPQED